MRSKRWLLLGIVLSGAVGLLAATQAWVMVSLTPGAAAVDTLKLAGYDLNPAVSPVAIAVLAAALALTIAGAVFRYVLGVLVALLGVSLAAIAFAVLGDPTVASTGRVADATGIAGSGQQAILISAQATTWPSAAIAAGVLLVICGLLVVLFGGRWQVAGRKYAARERRGQVATREPHPANPDRIADWDAMNQGEDPT